MKRKDYIDTPEILTSLLSEICIIIGSIMISILIFGLQNSVNMKTSQIVVLAIVSLFFGTLARLALKFFN